jgi:ParB-like chromosome segregation protein Spo0J
MGRVAAAAKLGLKSIPVIVAHGWSEEEKQAYRLADNELAARASWDPDLLRSELRDLKFGDFDLDLIGFEPDRLEEILAGLGSSGLTDPDAIPEIPDQPVTRPGDVLAVGRPPGRLWRQHQRGGCRAGAGGIAAPPDGHRSALRGRL